MKLRGLLPFFLLLLVFCAKKMLPPSPDRFSPRLVEVNARTRVQVELVFDEDIDPARLTVDSFEIVRAPGGDTIQLKGVSLGRERNRVLLWTQPQTPGRWTVYGVVWDIAGNKTRFRAGFSGATRTDTISPRILSIAPSPGSANLSRGVRISVRFSEPVDTASGVRYFIVPKDYETLFARKWEPNWQEVSFVFPDSLEKGQNFYFLLYSGVADLEGNKIKTPGYTYWTTDSVFQGKSVKGRTSVRNGVVFFNRERTEAIAPILEDGSFELKLRIEDYSVLGVSDTNGDGLVDLISPRRDFNPMSESLSLVFVPESIPEPIDAYCR